MEHYQRIRMAMNNRFPKLVIEELQGAGWTPGRIAYSFVKLLSDFRIFPAAESVLNEFGGLKIGACGTGVERATSQLVIQPDLAEGLSKHCGQVTAQGARLFPLGEIDYGHATILIDEHGNVYMFFDQLEFLAPSFDQALVMLLLGLNTPPPTRIGK
jgi:hypothetical protein